MNYDPQWGYQQNNQQYDKTAQNMGLASMILGIIGVVGGGLMFGIAGLVLAVMAGNRGYKEGYRTAGLVLSIISVVGGIITTILGIIAYFWAIAAGINILEYITRFL